MGVRRVALGGDILGSRRNPRTITTAITTEAPAPTTNRTYTTTTIKPTATAAATATATNYCTLADRGAPRGGLYLSLIHI